ncbi:MAG: alginate lyase family protein [Bacteroides sp.]|nr:alginate lyase family protein [Bacteroides sp.]
MPESSSAYSVKGPFENISRAGRYGYTKDPCERDFNVAYYNALQWVITGNVQHADKSMEILRAYASQLKAIHGPDDPLCAGLQGFMLVNAAEILRYTYPADTYSAGWNQEDSRQVESLFRNVFQPVLTQFYHTPPYTNGNLGIAVTKVQMAFGIFMNDRKLYEEAKEFFYKGKDNGSLPNYVAETGQLQESGRDQQHCMLGISCLAEIAELAWSQGEDLYVALDNRIMKGYEYLSASNLGYEVPFTIWKDITGKYCDWQNLGEDGMGRFRSVFEIGYNHYVYRKGLEMPYTG